MTTLKKFSVLLSPAAYGCLRGALKATEPENCLSQCQDILEINFHDNADVISVEFTGTQGHILAHLSAPIENDGSGMAPRELLEGVSPISEIPTDGAFEGFCLPSKWVKDTFPTKGRYARLDFEETGDGWRCRAVVWGGKRVLRVLRTGECELTPRRYPDWQRCLPHAARFDEKTDARAALQAGVLAAMGEIAKAVTCAADDRSPVAFCTRVFAPNLIHADVRPGYTAYADFSFRSISGVVVAMGMRL